MSTVLIRDARKDDSPALARVLIEATQNTFHGRVPDYCLDWISPEESAANWAKNFVSEDSLKPGYSIHVAESYSAGVIGLAMLGQFTAQEDHDPPVTKKYSHELRTLQIDPAWQRQGIGRRLLTRAVQTLSSEPSGQLLVGVLAENPNHGFYTRLGAVRIGARPYDWQGFHTEEILYGWYVKNGKIAG